MVPGLTRRTMADSKNVHSTEPTPIVEPSTFLSQQNASNSPPIEFIVPPSQPSSIATNEPCVPLNTSNSAQGDLVIF